MRYSCRRRSAKHFEHTSFPPCRGCSIAMRIQIWLSGCSDWRSILEQLEIDQLDDSFATKVCEALALELHQSLTSDMGLMTASSDREVDVGSHAASESTGVRRWQAAFPQSSTSCRFGTMCWFAAIFPGGPRRIQLVGSIKRLEQVLVSLGRLPQEN